jgi:2-amino-4-hydroxy-6-hydroxymethyldihydropteridine diphosphokinase
VKRVYLSLGSNIGNRELALETAITKLHRKDFRVLRVSSVFETAAIGYTAQSDFLNCVVEAETTLLPMSLLQRVSGIEREMGRKRIIQNGPRNIDIDILLFANAVVETPHLQIPHPRMSDRRFVLEPLAELAPDLRHPILHKTIRQLLATAPQQRIVRRAEALQVPLGE